MFGIGAMTEASDIRSAPLEISDFRQIKPEEGTSFQEAKNFWDNLFGRELPEDENRVTDEDLKEKEHVEQDNPHKEVVDGKDYYYDDNGNLYRIGNELQPNSSYEINGYKFETDEKGRIISAEGKLHLKEHEGRLPIRDSIEDIGQGDEQEGDDRGHLIGDQFDGPNGMENMIPQDAEINRNDFRKLENALAKEVKAGKEVSYKVEPVYDGDSRRPSGFVVTYSIDGEESIRTFPNGKTE